MAVASFKTTDPIVFSLTSTESGRELIDEIRAAVLIQTMPSSSWAKLNRLHLSGKSLSLSAAQAFVRDAISLIEYGMLTHAHLNDMIASRPEAEALQILNVIAEALAPHGPSLVSLDLSDNALGRKGVDAIAPLLTSCRATLQTLSFNNNGLERRATTQISHLMTNGEQIATKLIKFHTFNNLLESAGAIGLSPLLSKSPMLNDLRISSTRIGAEGCIAIAAACKQSGAPIQRLDFADNNFMPEGLVALCRDTIASLPMLGYLNLSATAMGLEGLRALEEALTNSGAPIEYLDVSCNDLPEESAPILGKLLSAIHDTIMHFKASENELCSDGCIAVAQAIRGAPKLTSLDLSVNEITEAGATVLAECLPSSLRQLELNGNFISAAGVAAITEACDDFCKLGDMDLNDEEYEEDAVEDEEEAEDEDEVEVIEAVANSVESLKI